MSIVHLFFFLIGNFGTGWVFWIVIPIHWVGKNSSNSVEPLKLHQRKLHLILTYAKMWETWMICSLKFLCWGKVDTKSWSVFLEIRTSFPNSIFNHSYDLYVFAGLVGEGKTRFSVAIDSVILLFPYSQTQTFLICFHESV